MRHYLLTRSAYAPSVPIEVNRYRLALTRGITARSLRSQTTTDLTWLVLVDVDDPLLPERTAAFVSSGLEVILQPAGDLERADRFDRPWGPWSDYLDWSDSVLTTRLDDDDAFAPWTLKSVRGVGERYAKRGRHLLSLPSGWRVRGGLANRRYDRISQFGSLFAPKGDRCTVMDMNHTAARKLARDVPVTREPAWLWLRHGHARSQHSRASTQFAHTMKPIGRDLRATFDIDWTLVE